MKGYKYVKFSRSTVKINPNMVFDAYTKLIESKEKGLKGFKAAKHKTTLRMDSRIMEDFFAQLRHLSINETIERLRLHGGMEVYLNPKEVIVLHNHIMKKNQEELKLMEELEDIKLEFNKLKDWVESRKVSYDDCGW